MKPTKKLKTCTDQIYKLRDKMINQIKDFFDENKHVSSIDIEDVEGGLVVMRGDKEVTHIKRDEVIGIEADFSLDELDLVDLDEIISIINHFVVDENKTFKRCQD